MKRDPIRVAGIFGMMAVVSFVLYLIVGFSPLIVHSASLGCSFSLVIGVRVLDSIATLLLLVAFATLLKLSQQWRKYAVLGVAGAACLVLVKIGNWTLWLGGERLLDGVLTSLSLAVNVLSPIGWFCLFFAIVRLTKMCGWARICALLGVGRDVLVSAALAAWSVALGKLRSLGDRIAFAFEGRSRRKEYWLWMLWCSIFVNVVLAIPVYVLLFDNRPPESLSLFDNSSLESLSLFFNGPPRSLRLWWSFSGALMQLMTLPVCVRRLHDRNLSGWWLLLFDVVMWIPVLNVFAGIAHFVIVGCLDGTVGPNNYGDDPKGRKAVACVPLPSATHPAASKTPEDRLVKIKELYEKGLLTEAEYNLKRSAVISEI